MAVRRAGKGTGVIERLSERPARCSIVVPAYNTGAYIEATLRSVVAQSMQDWELILVDDGSTDDTLARARAVTDTRIRVVSQPNAGPSAARNHGLRLTTAPFVVFLDSDDVYAPDALERLLQPFASNPALVASYGEVTTIDAAGQTAGTAHRPVFAERPSGDIVERLVQRNFIVTGGALCIRRTAIDAAGDYRADLCVSEDLEFWCRVALQGPFQYVAGPPVLFYRIHEGSVVRTRGKDPRDALRCIDAIFANPAMQARLGADSAALKRKGEASAYSFTANEYLRGSKWGTARGLLWESLRRNPWQPRELILFAFACLGWLPTMLRRHLK